MADELRHKSLTASVLPETSSAGGWEHVGTHILNSQATGDIIYASSATQLTRLGIGATNTVLHVIGGVPVWATTLAGLTLTTPVLGVATATSINKLTLTQPATGATLTLVEGSSLITAGAYAITLTSTGATGVTLPTTGTLATLAGIEALTNKTLTSPTINGTIATTGLTLPAVTLGGNMTVTGRVFDAGAGSAQINTTGGAVGLLVQSTNDGAYGALIAGNHISASPAVNDQVFILVSRCKDLAGATLYPMEMQIVITNITNDTEASKMVLKLHDAGAQNTAMELSGAGVLSVDLGGTGLAAQVDLFDSYDDALVLRQGIQQNNRELLANMGVLERKDTGSGYMMKLQPMVRLLAGGIYQTRALIDDLTERLMIAESKLALLPEGR